MILKAAVLLIYLGSISLAVFASSITFVFGQSGCGPGTTLVPSTNECVPATVKCGAGTMLNVATNQCDLVTTSQTTQPNATTSQTTQPNATGVGEVGNATAGTTVATGGASEQCKADEEGLGDLCVPRSCTELLNSFAMNLRGLTQEQVYNQCMEKGLLSK
ncbi:MAG TPA: hypothetical protein VH415_14530 [Nitrososphaeraceae archaeon]